MTEFFTDADPSMDVLVRETLELMKLAALCEEDGDCLNWTGAKDGSGTPVARLPGSRKLIPVRRIVIEVAKGLMRAGLVATCSCRRKGCVAPEHAESVTRKTLVLRAVENTAYHLRPTRNAKVSATSRLRGKLNDDATRAEIMASDLPQRELARIHGVAQSTIGELKLGRIYKDYRNPFSQLVRAGA